MPIYLGKVISSQSTKLTLTHTQDFQRHTLNQHKASEDKEAVDAHFWCLFIDSIYGMYRQVLQTLVHAKAFP